MSVTSKQRGGPPLHDLGSRHRPLDLPDVDPGQLRTVSGFFPTGVAIVTAATTDGAHGCTANAFTSLSLDPPLVLVCLDRKSNTHPHLLRARAFAINVLRAGPGAEALCRVFAGKAEDKFMHVESRPGRTGAPILAEALAWLECELDATYEGGDHTIFVGRVVAAASGEGEPIVFYRGSFGALASTV